MVVSYLVLLLAMSLSLSQPIESLDTDSATNNNDTISSIEDSDTNLSSLENGSTELSSLENASADINNTINSPSDTELCSCFNIDLICSPIETEDEICYHYSINRISTESYCLDTINYIILGVGNDCDLNSTIFDDALTNYAPKTCYSINTDSTGVNIDGIGIIINDDISDSIDSSISSSDSDIPVRRMQLLSSSISISTSDSFDDISSEFADDFIVFSLCFDSTLVSDTQSNGTIEIALNNNVFTCDVENTLPGFCNAPTPASTPLICDSTDAINIGFLLDESGSVKSEDWQFMMSFVNRIIQIDISPNSAVSLWEYASPHAFEQFLDWTEITEDRTVFTNALIGNNYNSGGQTYTWDAVNRVLDNFWSYRFNCTDDCDTRTDMLFVLTDGSPSDIVCPNITARVNNTDIDIILININAIEGVTDWPLEVNCLDARDNGQDIYYIPEFSFEGLLAVEGLIRNKTCSDMFPPGESIRPEEGTQWIYDDGEAGRGPVPTSTGTGGKGGGGDTGRRRRLRNDKSRLFETVNMYYW